MACHLMHIVFYNKYSLYTKYIMQMQHILLTLGVQVRNMKMDLNIYGTGRGSGNEF